MQSNTRAHGPHTASLWQPDLRGHIESEDAFLALVDRFFPVSSGHFPRGRGHDCAELEGLPGSLALSTDMFLEGTHFSRQYFTPGEAGAKALTSAVSDLAAAGARPLGFSLGLAMPGRMPVCAVEDMLCGMAEKAALYGIVLTGGDVARSNVLGFSLCVWGSGRHGEKSFLRRGGALPGDHVFLVGEAGLAHVGLHFLEGEGRDAVTAWPLSVAAHLDPRALVEEGGKIAAIAHTLGDNGISDSRFSLMDLSDGLSRDLPRLLMGAGMELELDGLTFPDELHRASAIMRVGVEELFLTGGEDYALLGTCPAGKDGRLAAALPGVRFLGRVRKEPGIVRADGKALPGGFDHFSLPAEAHESVSQEIKAGKHKDAIHDAIARKKAAEAVTSLSQIGRQAWEAGLMAGFNGNASCRLDLGADRGECCVITRSGAAKGRLGERDCVALALPGGEALSDLLPEPLSGASSESPLHIEIYTQCPESAVILHVHPPKLLALSLALPEDDLLRLPLPEAECYRAAMAVVPFLPPGGEALARAVGQAARNHRAVWMQRHGLVVHGTDFTAALALCEELEQLAGVQAMLLGLERKNGGNIDNASDGTVRTK